MYSSHPSSALARSGVEALIGAALVIGLAGCDSSAKKQSALSRSEAVGEQPKLRTVNPFLVQ